MVKATSLLHLATAVALSLLVATATTRLTNHAPRVEAPTPAAAPVVRVAVAAQDLPRGTRLTQAMLKTVPWEEAEAPAGAVADGKPFEGWIVTESIAAGEPLAADKLSQAGVAALVSSGKRAFSVRAARIKGLGEIARPGSRTDVLVTMDAAGAEDRKITKLVLENIPLLMVKEEPEPAPKRTGKDEMDTTAVYTLELTPEEAEKLAHATAHGEIHFALRNPADDGIVLTGGADYDAMAASYRQEKRNAPVIRSGGQTRPAFVSESIRGLKLEKETVAR